MAYTPYSTHELLGVQRKMRPPTSFWLNLCFGRQINFDSQYIDFEMIDESRDIAPFVSPMVQGRVMKKDGTTLKRFAPAYVKPKDVVDPNHLVTRMAGEAYTGSQSVGSRRDAIVADLLQKQKNKIMRRWEWMASRAVLDGAVTVEGEGYPTAVVDFGRDASLKKTLTGAAQWGQAGVSIVDHIETWNQAAQDISTYAPTMLVMGTEVWKVFRKDAEVKDLLDKNYRIGESSFLDIAPGNGEIAQYKGKIGTLEIWVYNDVYKDETGATVPFMSSKRVIGLNPAGIMGVRCFGAILDPSAGYQPLDIFAKNWLNEDPAAEYLMSQSAPLMVPMEPNAAWVADVLE